MKAILEKMLDALLKRTDNGEKPLMLYSTTFECPIESGLCTLAVEVLSDEEYEEFNEYMYGKFPDKYWFEFIWESGKAKPRIEWLEEQIKILES